jgi:hypothetical protein
MVVVVVVGVKTPPVALKVALACAELLLCCSSSTLSLSFLMYFAASSKLLN